MVDLAHGGRRTIATEHTQSLADVRQSEAETPDRLNRTGEAEVLTVDGEPRAVLLSPAAYEAMAKAYWLARDVANIRISLAEIEAGQFQTIGDASREIRAKLLAMKAALESGAVGEIG